MQQEGKHMQRVTGIGGIFFKAGDPESLYQWYEKHLGIKREPDGSGAVFHWQEVGSAGEKSRNDGMTVWAVFPKDTKYFEPGRADFMINYRVEDLDSLLQTLQEAGVRIDGRQDEDYGRFAWIVDPEGNRIELWEPRRR
jgi:predicted enzyme related to lactoylglutathione lyase